MKIFMQRLLHANLVGQADVAADHEHRRDWIPFPIRAPCKQIET
jgi:hypothetical protein